MAVCLPATLGAAAAEVSADPKVGSEPAPDRPATRIDQLHDSTGRLLDGATQWIDSFFVSDSYDTFETKNRVRLRLDLDRLEHIGWESSTQVKLSVHLPGLSERLRLVINDGEAADEDEAIDVDDDGNEIAARWVAALSQRLSASVDGGVRIKSGRADFFGRLNARLQYAVGDDWEGRTTNRLYYYTNSGWRNDLRQYFDRPLGERWLFRARTRVQHREEKNYSPALEQKFSLAHKIDDRSAIVYESFWQRDSAEDSPYYESGITLPSGQHYDSVVVRLRYRRNVWRPWMFVELWPGVSWMEELDWDPSVGVRLRLEINVGRPGTPALSE